MSFITRLSIVKLKLKVSAVAVGRVLIVPKYFAGMLIFIFLAANLVIWSLNFELAQYIIMDSGLALADKLRFFSTSVRDIFTTYESNQALGIAIFSVLFGINMSLLFYVLSNIGIKKMAKQSSASGAGLAFAVISGGCVACGASLLAPIAISLGVTSGAFLRDFSLWLNWISSGLILISIYQLGQLAATAQAKK